MNKDVIVLQLSQLFSSIALANNIKLYLILSLVVNTLIIAWFRDIIKQNASIIWGALGTSCYAIIIHC